MKTEKVRVIEDILSWKNEMQETGGRDYGDKELMSDFDKLRAKSMTELQSHWHSTVGEWIASRGDVNEEYNNERDRGDFSGSFEDYLDEQFRRVKEGKEKAYGYVSPISIPK